METVLLSFVVILLAFLGMAIGVMVGGKKRCIKGSCGGINNAAGDGKCGACGRDAGESSDHELVA